MEMIFRVYKLQLHEPHVQSIYCGMVKTDNDLDRHLVVVLLLFSFRNEHRAPRSELC